MGKDTSEITWHCCSCGFSPHNWDLHRACIECGHEACWSCPIEPGGLILTPPPEYDSTVSLGPHGIYKPHLVYPHALAAQAGSGANESWTKRGTKRQHLSSCDEHEDDSDSPVYKQPRSQELYNPVMSASPVPTPSADEDFHLEGPSTTPERSEEHADQHILDAIMDPGWHSKPLNDLECEIAECLRLPEDATTFHTTIEGCLTALDRAINALSILEIDEFCSGKFNILVDDPKREAVAAPLVFHETDLSDLQKSLRDIGRLERTFDERSSAYEIFDRKSPPVPFDEDYSFHQNVLEQIRRIEHLLSPLTIETGGGSIKDRLCKSFSAFTAVIRMGLISYTGSHVSDFDLALWDEPIGDGPFALSETIYLHRRRLACLEEFIGGPIWLFGRRDVPHTASGYRVSIDFDTLDDLWGPIWATPLEDDPSKFGSVFTERGTLHRVPATPEQGLAGDEIPCHWERQSALAIRQMIDQPPDGQDALYISNSSKMLIGLDAEAFQPTIHTTDSSADLEDPQIPPTQLVLNPECLSCPRDLRAKYSVGLQWPGVSESRRVRHSSQFGANASISSPGVVIRLGASRKYKPTKKTTLKSKMIADCVKMGPEDPIGPILCLKVGLEVSGCTQNARRITLWEALQLAHRKTGTSTPNDEQDMATDCTHDVDQRYSCVANCWRQDEQVQLDRDPRSSCMWREKSRLIRSILMMEDTGVDSTGELKAWFPFTSYPQILRIAPKPNGASNGRHGWIPMILDTCDTSAFPVVSSKCLEAPPNPHCLPRQFGICQRRPEACMGLVRSVFETTLEQTNLDHTWLVDSSSDVEQIPDEGDLCLSSDRGAPLGTLARVKNNRVILEFDNTGPVNRLFGKWSRVRSSLVMLRESVDVETATKVRSSVLVV